MNSVPEPIKEQDQTGLPSALTFFLTRAQRLEVLRALKAIDRDRVVALLKAFNISAEAEHTSRENKQRIKGGIYDRE